MRYESTGPAARTRWTALAALLLVTFAVGLTPARAQDVDEVLGALLVEVEETRQHLESEAEWLPQFVVDNAGAFSGETSHTCVLQGATTVWDPTAHEFSGVADCARLDHDGSAAGSEDGTGVVSGAFTLAGPRNWTSSEYCWATALWGDGTITLGDDDPIPFRYYIYAEYGQGLLTATNVNGVVSLAPAETVGDPVHTVEECEDSAGDDDFGGMLINAVVEVEDVVPAAHLEGYRHGYDSLDHGIETAGDVNAAVDDPGWTSVAVNGTVLEITASEGARNHIDVSHSPYSPVYWVRDGDSLWVDDPEMRPGPGCEGDPQGTISCDATGVTEIRVSLGDGDDSFETGYDELPLIETLVVDAGPGDDRLHARPHRDGYEPVDVLACGSGTDAYHGAGPEDTVTDCEVRLLFWDRFVGNHLV